MVAYELAKKGFRVLVCDLDPQANSTQLLRRTYGLQNNKELPIKETMMVAIQEGNLGKAVVNVMPNLYLLPSHKDFVNYPDFLELTIMPTEKNYKERRIAFLVNYLNQLKMIMITLYLMFLLHFQYLPIQLFILLITL